MSSLGRRSFLFASLVTLVAGRSRAARSVDEAITDLDKLGRFENVLGKPGVVVGVPHGTADSGTLEAGRILCKRLDAGGVFVTGFWDPKTRQRINVNRDSEELIGPNSEVLRQWASPRAVAANARYTELVKQTAQGPIKAFYELHSNHRRDVAGSIEVSTLGVSYSEAVRFREAFLAARDRLAPDVPRMNVHVSPYDKVGFPNYAHASSISRLSEKGCAIEHPGHIYDHRPWRVAYANCLADAISAAGWVS
jgi:hypothetical protein